MQFINLIKNEFAKNIYFSRFCYDLINFLLKNYRAEKIFLEMSQRDYFYDTTYLKEFRKSFKTEFKPGEKWNIYIYGIWNSLFKNCNINYFYETPSIEHGLILYDSIFSDIKDTARASCVTFSQFRKKIIQSYFNIPVFCVGPYIHYSNFFYTSEQLEKMKKKLGKTLLVFPTHSTDMSTVSTKQNLFLDIIKKEASSFESVLVNVFWWNINDPITKQFESEGYQIISCGYRNDISFLPRLKSYLYLADQAIGDGIGTHIGYCIDCNVPFTYKDIGTLTETNVPEEIENWKSCDYNSNRIKEAFLNSSEIGLKEKEAYKYYWGIDNVKDSNELQKICDITRDLSHLTYGFRSKLYKKSIELLDRYQKEDLIKYQLLLEALPEKLKVYD